MKITKVEAYKVVSKELLNNPTYGYFTETFYRIDSKVWLNFDVANSDYMQTCSRNIVAKLEEEFISINNVMHEQLELF